MAPSLASLLQPLTQQQAAQLVTAYYQAAGFPTTAWEQFGVDVARVQAFAQALSDVLTNYIPAIAGGSLLDYAPNYPGWTPLMAQEVYNLPQNLATFTQGAIVATNTSSTPYSFSPSSQLIMQFSASGNRYNTGSGSGTIPANGSLSFTVYAENPGSSYADPSNANPSNGNPTALTLVTPLPGVWLNNPSTNYSSVTHIGSGTGTITLGGSPSGSHAVVLRIDATNTSTPASVSYSLDGAAFASLGSISSQSNLGGVGINVTLVNGGSGTSWVLNDTFSFSTPASWITSQGANLEADTALATRCRNRWPTLAAIPTSGLYALLAQSTPSVGSQVTQVFTVPDATINNKVNIIVAGPGGVLPGATITAIQNFITPYAVGCDLPVVGSPTTTAITLAYTVTCYAQQLAAVQSAITTALDNYIASIPVNGTIRIAAIIDIIMNISGVIDCTNVTINGGSVNVPLGSSSTFVLPAYPPTLNGSFTTQ